MFLPLLEFLHSFWPIGLENLGPSNGLFLQENGIQLDASAHSALGSIPANDAARVPRSTVSPAGGEIVVMFGL